MKKTRIALIGAGYIADYHARGLKELAHVEMAAVVAKTPESARNFSEKYGIPNAFTSISPVVNDPSIDAVVISTPNFLHAPQALEFLRKGIDVFIEKPMAMNTEEGREIAQVAREHNSLVMIGHMWRFDTETQYIEACVRSQKLGKVIKTKGYGIHENWGPEGWFTQKELAGGGALADMGVHAIDTVRYLLGDPKPLKVYARIATHFGDYEVDDTGILVVTWDNGAESIIESGWWHPHMDGPEASTSLFGTKGYANLFPTFLKLKKGETSEEIRPEAVQKDEHCDQRIYTSQMRYFIDCILSRSQPVPGIDEGLTVMRIIDAAYRSAETGKAIDL
ncbi:Gfo/Idh/MocA family protein [Pseudozobellia thermophila]|uniref:Predicted dehydrogenase n=1 Tax=Pseudozobellia thermophila TaxID=192903 RepID=A0A1M6I2W1_9FLAO|nr:Gfo/Idh/MocA family oxidoreductase [Pseudozobellia thermophila]SHJ28827.1 Predicted dehydrogenase [Pseudozobellia thermophila]